MKAKTVNKAKPRIITKAKPKSKVAKKAVVKNPSISLGMPIELYNKLLDKAKSTECSKSVLVRKAIEQFLAA